MNDMKTQILQIGSVKDGYNNWAQTYDDEHLVLVLLDELHNQRRKNAFVHLQRKETVLDLCCGSGRHIPFLENNFSYVAGVDFSPNMLELAKKKVRKSSTELFCLDIFDCKLNRKFDFINFSLAMMHFHDPMKIIHFVHEHLKPNGVVDVIDGTVEVLEHSEGPRYHVDNKIFVIPHKKYSKDEILLVLKELEFEIIDHGDILFEPTLLQLSKKLSRYQNVKCLYYITAKKV